jgi:hypothetical protein
MKKPLLLSFLLLLTCRMPAQSWIDMLQQPGENFYDIQKAFNNYWKDRDHTAKSNGYKPFKRWEAFVGPRVYPSGDISLLSTTWENYSEFLQKNSFARLSSSTTWTAIGPMGAPTGSVNNLPRKAGRDNFITFLPGNTNTFWVGAPAGGLWKTTTGGTSWTTNTDLLTVIGCSDLAIDPVNTNIMYLATGDGDSDDTKSIGVLKSTDGGNTWNTTGLTFAVSQQYLIRRLIINPSNPAILLAATSIGIYRSINSGVSWSLVLSINAYDVEFKPGDPTVVYAAGGAFYRSTNSGASFTNVSSGITTGAQRMNIAVTPADVNYVYVLGSNVSSSGLQGVYRSVNSGASFALMANSPDILANSCTSPSGTGQGWYDLALAVSPLNKDEVVAGGVNIWRSINGGSSWSVIGCWNSNSNPAYVHADQHELEYTPGGVLFSANDGGIFKYTGTSWTDLSNPRNIAQIYKIGLSTISPNLWITGHQDNGTNMYNNGSYSAIMAGDGMDCFIDRTSNSNMFASYYNGNFQRSITGGASWSSATSGLSGTPGWVSPWKQDPVNASRLYCGYSQMFVSNNLGQNWTALNSMGGSGTIVEFAIAPSNNLIIFAIRGNSIFKTSNGGTSWSVINGSIPVGSAEPTFITIDPLNANNVWVTLSGYSAGNKVYQSLNGGSSWTNVSYNLPNLPANCSVYQPNTNGIIYVGMDVGVYYKDITSTSWNLYNSGLPNVPISDLEISPAAPTKLRAATYGRGVYEVDVVPSSGAPPVPNFTVAASTLCENTSMIVKDNSANNPTSWSWAVSPTTGVSITGASSSSATISFAVAGTYNIGLTSANSFGTGPLYSKTVTVVSGPTVSFSTLNPTVCVGDDALIIAAGANSYTWNPGNIVADSYNITNSGPATFTVMATGANGCTKQNIYAFITADCTDLPEKQGSEKPFTVYPNPVGQKLMISAKMAYSGDLDIRLYDVTGKLISIHKAVYTAEKNEFTLNVNHLENGIYFVKLTDTNEHSHVFRVMKE